MDKYKEWIRAHYSDFSSALGQCKVACQRMKDVFPELEITNGFVTLMFTREQTHWWCKDPDGNIVDPTAIQYREGGTPIIDYEEITDDHDERKYPKTKCMNCGEYYYVKPELEGVMHTKECEKEFCAYLNGGE